MSTEGVLAEKGLLPEDGSKPQLHHLFDCRAFAKVVWVDKALLKCELNFTAERLHEVLHANDEYYYDVCPGEREVNRWFKEFVKEVC